MQRRDFIESLSGPVLAACAVCLGACSKSDGASNSSGVVPPSNVNFTIDLGSSLIAIGSSLVQSSVIVVRLAAGNTPSSFTAVQVACTHEGAFINYNQTSNNFICPLHGSVFTTGGAVNTGPAATALKKFNVAVSGNTLTVSG